MKKVLIIATIMFGVVSCKKNNDDVAAPMVLPTLTISSAYASQMVLQGKVKVSEHSFKTGSFRYVAFDITVAGTVNKSFLRDYSFIIKEKSDTNRVVFSSPATTMVPVAYKMDDFIELKPNTEYTITQYVTAQASAVGTIITTVNAEYPTSETATSWIRNVVGQTITISPYHTVPVFEWVELTSVMVDSVEMVGYELSITNPGTKRISFPEFTYALNIVDVGNDDTISASRLKWVVDGVDRTIDVRFTNSAGTVTGVFPEGNNKLHVVYVNGIRELGVDPGQKVTLKLLFTTGGLRNNGNGMSVQFLSDEVPLSSIPGYLNLNSPGTNLKITTSQAASSAGTVVHLPWSPNGQSHSAIPGGSSKDWVSGYGIPSQPIRTITQ